MNAVAVVFLRLVAIILGYTMAVFAACLFFFILLMGMSGPAHMSVSATWFRQALAFLPIMAAMAAYFAFLPALIAIAVTEFAGRRDWLFHTLAGALVGLATTGLTPWLTWIASEPGAPRPDSFIDPMFLSPRTLLIAIGCGMVGGMAYWLATGRRAGLWREPAEPGSS